MPGPQDTLQVEISPYEGGLRVRVTGPSSIGSTLAYWRRIAAEARARGARSLLLVDEMTGDPLDEADWLRLVTDMHGEGLEQLRIAHVKPLGLQQVEFCEIFARDAGIEARVFENEVLAGIWLRYGSE